MFNTETEDCDFGLSSPGLGREHFGIGSLLWLIFCTLEKRETVAGPHLHIQYNATGEAKMNNIIIIFYIKTLNSNN